MKHKKLFMYVLNVAMIFMLCACGSEEQPDEIKNVLLGYADCGRMMMQRIINIACETMEFVAEEKQYL